MSRCLSYYRTGKEWDIHILHNETWKFPKSLDILYAHDERHLTNQIQSACYRIWRYKFGGGCNEQTDFARYDDWAVKKFFEEHPDADHFRQTLKEIPVVSSNGNGDHTCQWHVVRDILQKNYLKIERKQDLNRNTLWSFNKVV